MEQKRLRPTLRELEDLGWRALWTFLAGVLGGIPAAGLIDVEVWQAALLAGASGVTTVVLVFARQRLGGLNAPGAP